MVKSVDISKQPGGQIKTPVAADVASESSSEWYSQYEEVSDGEFEEHHGNPNYIEVSAEEAEKYLKKNKSLA
ncbi:CIC11C00000003108 [Sungouiella intermedia]|uniref:CIC11C00000003108 n=1 Tax=Sungouiella intermedia TaxID=45354 RepID=A0A1L0DAG5_9ASCO|nr:CIC11C00000003108 [[Candida] intermedia]